MIKNSEELLQNIVLTGLSIEQVGKLPKWLLDNIEKNAPLIDQYVSNKAIEKLQFLLDPTVEYVEKYTIIDRIATLSAQQLNKGDEEAAHGN